MTVATPLRVVVVDDHPVVRDGLRAILQSAGIEVVGEASNGHDGIGQVRSLLPDVVLMDIAMPLLNGVECTRTIRASTPHVRVVALSMHGDRRYVVAMLDAGAAGFVVKSATSDELVDALRVVARGSTYVSPSVAHDVVAQVGGGAPVPPPHRPTPRERQVLQLVAEGKSSKEIASILGIALPTVETHRRQLMDKLCMRSIAELTKYAIREGLTSLEG